MTTRRSNGKEIMRLGHVTKIHKNRYKVESQSQKGVFYDVKLGRDSKVSCTCKDYAIKKGRCKHIYAVEFYRGFGASTAHKITPKSGHKTMIKAPNVASCPRHGTKHVIMKGLRKNKHYAVQVYYCKNCKRKFSENLGFERLKASPKMITAAINMYFNGESFPDVVDTLLLLGIKVTPKTVENWVVGAIAKIYPFVSGLTPQVSDEWRSDEMFISIGGQMTYLYLMMDDQTRYWISGHLADTKETANICSMFQDAAHSAKFKPETMITDAASNYHSAWKHEYKPKNNQDKKTQHIRHIHFDDDHNNNKMERAIGELRDREKVMRGLKSKNTAVIPGMIIKHNFMHKHLGLNGQTSSEAAGLNVEGINKWLVLIQNGALQQSKWVKG